MKLALRTKYSLLILSLIISVVILFAALVSFRFRSTMSDVTSLTSREMETELLSQLEKRAKVVTLLLSENLVNPVYQYNLERIYDLTKAAREQKDVAYVYVYDTAGRIIHDGTKENMLLDQVLPDQNAVRASKPIIQRTADTLAVTVPIKINDERLGGVKMGFSLEGLRSAIQNMETNLAAIGTRGTQETIKSIAAVAVGVTAFGIIAAILVAQGLSRPIKLLSMLSARVGRGEYDVEIPIKRSDELGELASSFGKMAVDLKVSAERIEGHLQRITALHEIDLAIISTLDLPVVLEFLLDKFDLFLPSASASTVRLFNRDTGQLEPVACKNLNQLVWKAEEWKSGRGITNVVAETKAPLVVENIQKDPRTRNREFFHRYNLVSYVGVLSAYTKEEHRFSTKEVEFFSTLAGQAAIAIHNSQLYERVRKQAVDLERANQVKDEFLSVMSHELRTPLNVIVGYIGMVRDKMLGEINEEEEAALTKAMARSNDLLSMITDILNVTRIEANEITLERYEINLKSFLDDLKSRYELPLDKGLALNWDYPAELPVVHTDSEKLKHILQNLIHNAIKFTEKGGVSVSARHVPEAETVEFKVADTGVGIPKEKTSLIFEMFRQADSSETRSHGGVGIGLYIAKKFTDLLGGKIEVETEPGSGSTFTVMIPVSCGSGGIH
jgi:signal transduction histidine kinase/HAMP domain-containing protein